MDKETLESKTVKELLRMYNSSVIKVATANFYGQYHKLDAEYDLQFDIEKIILSRTYK